MAKRVKIGDVIEVETSRGLAYAQVTHKNKEWGSLIRVASGFLSQRPDNLAKCLDQETAFMSFIPLQQIVNRNIFCVIGNTEVPKNHQDFPLFRASGFIDRNGKVHDWWFWDGDETWKAGKLTDDQKRLPIQEVINDTLLIERIETNWRPEVDV